MAKNEVAPPSGFPQEKMYVWVKGLETKVNNMVREVDVLKNDFIRKANSLREDFKDLNLELLELKHAQQKTQQTMDLIIKELKQTAGQDEIMTLKKYVDYWNPMNFVTQRDLDRAVESKLNKK